MHLVEIYKYSNYLDVAKETIEINLKNIAKYKIYKNRVNYV